MPKYFLEPGYMIVTPQPYYLYAVLGSCIAVCLWDETAHVGGMNHFIYPRSSADAPTAKYGDAAITELIRLMLKHDAKKETMKAHLVGGSINQELGSEVGKENSEIALAMLASQGIEIVSSDIGGTSGRKAVFQTATGEITVIKGIRIRKEDWYCYE